MPEVDPDQLLKELDAKLAQMRASRRKPAGENHTVRIGAVAVCCVLLILFLWLVQSFLSQMVPHRSAPGAVSAQAGAGK